MIIILQDMHFLQVIFTYFLLLVNTWILDSGTSNHMCSSLGLFILSLYTNYIQTIVYLLYLLLIIGHVLSRSIQWILLYFLVNNHKDFTLTMNIYFPIQFSSQLLLLQNVFHLVLLLILLYVLIHVRSHMQNYYIWGEDMFHTVNSKLLIII